MSWILQKMEKRAVIFPPLPSKAFLSLGFIGTLRLVRGCSCSRMCESYTKTEVEKHVTYFDRTAGSSCQLICTCGVITVPYITLHKSREGFSSKSLHPSSDQTSSDRMILEDQLRSDFFFFMINWTASWVAVWPEQKKGNLAADPMNEHIMYLHVKLWASQVALVVKNLPAKAGVLRDAGSIPGSGRSPGGEHGNPLQYSCLENPMDRGAWRKTVHGVTKSWTQLKRFSTHACGVMQ